MILCTGFYHRNNLGDDIFYLLFKKILEDIGIPFQIISLDDIKTIDPNVDTIILGGGEILNSYFLSKIEKLTINFKGKIIAYSCELPKGDIIKEVNLVDCFIVRNFNDYQRLLNHFKQDTINPYIEYLPDIVCSYPIKRQSIYTKGKKVSVCLARSIFANNKYYNLYLKKICLFLKYVSELGWSIDLVSFNTSPSDTESDLLINEDLEKISKSLGVNVKNTHWINDFDLEQSLSKSPKSKVIDNKINFKLNNVIEQFKSSDIIICSRYHAHVLAVVCGKPVFSIPHTKKAKDQIKEFGLDQWVLEPELDSASRPIDFNVPKAIELFNKMTQNYNEICRTIMKTNFISIEEHKNKLEKYIKQPKRNIPPYYTFNNKCTEIVNEIINNLKSTYSIDKFDCEESLYNNDFRNRITRFILYKLCKDPGACYFYGLSSKILKPKFNIEEDLKWIYHDYYSKNQITYQLVSSINSFPDKLKVLNLSYIEPHLLNNIHRSGWARVVNETSVLHNSNGIIFDMFCDKTFHWGEATYNDLKLLPYDKPWIGIVHHTPNQIYTEYNTTQMIKKDSWNNSLKNCIGIYTMSNWLSHWFKSEIPELFVETLIHPTEIPEVKFSYYNFIQNQDKKVIQIGGWLRNIYSIYRINVPKYITKAHLIGKDMDGYIKPNCTFGEILSKFDDIDKNCYSFGNISQDQSKNKYIYFMLEYIKSLDIEEKDLIIKQLLENQMSVRLINRVENNDYDIMLSNNIVFIDLIEASACNTLTECIVRNTPILIKPHPAVIERLGLNYPMYWNKYSDIEKLLTLDNIKKTHEYLLKLDKSCYTHEYWINSIINSFIYQKAYNLINPEDNIEQLINETTMKISNQVTNISNQVTNISNQVTTQVENINKQIIVQAEYLENKLEDQVANLKNTVELKLEANILYNPNNLNNLNNIIDKNENYAVVVDLVNGSNDINIIDIPDVIAEKINNNGNNLVNQAINEVKNLETNIVLDAKILKKKSLGKKFSEFFGGMCCKGIDVDQLDQINNKEIKDKL